MLKSELKILGEEHLEEAKRQSLRPRTRDEAHRRPGEAAACTQAISQVSVLILK